MLWWIRCKIFQCTKSLPIFSASPTPPLWALWFLAVIIYVVTFTSAGRKQPEHLILFTTAPKNKLRLQQTSCWCVWTSAWHFVGCLQNTPNPWTVSSYGWVSQPFPHSARLLQPWTIPAHFKDQICCCCVTGRRWRERCHAIQEGLDLGKSSQPLLVPWSSHQEKQGWGSAVVPGGKKKHSKKITLNQLGCHLLVVCWFMTTSQSCPQTVWQPRQTEILNSMKCRPIPFHLQHLPCTRTSAPHKSAVPVPGELSPGLLQLVRAVSGDRISTLMLGIDLCLIYIALIWFSPRHHEDKSKVMPTRVRSYAGFKLVQVKLRLLNATWFWWKGRAEWKISCLTHGNTK